jgi:hypothetical protein
MGSKGVAGRSLPGILAVRNDQNKPFFIIDLQSEVKSIYLLSYALNSLA